MNESDFRNIQLIRDNLDVFNKHIYNEPMDGWDVSERRMSDYEFFHTVTTLMANFEPRFYAICGEIASEGNDIPIPLRQLINVLADTDRLNIVGYDDDVKLWANKWAGIFSRVTVWLRFLDETFPNYNWGVQQMNRWFGHHRTTTSTITPTPKKSNRGALDRERFINELPTNPAFLDAVKKGDTDEQFNWNRSLRDLVEFLQPVLPYTTDRNGMRHTRWAVADGVFTWNGRKITGRKLNDTFQHIPKDY